MFHHFVQNNSGGRFDINHAAGISHHVIVEGTSIEDIICRAETIGLYWDGCHEGFDCSCCGDRWYRPWGGADVDAVPSIYGQDVSSGVYTDTFISARFIEDGPEGYIHYLDGRIVPIKWVKGTSKTTKKTKTVKKTKKTTKKTKTVKKTKKTKKT